MRSEKSVKRARAGYAVMSVLLCALGAVFIIFPGTSLFVICKITGAVICIYGLIKILGYFTHDLYRLAFQFDLAYGLLILLVGIMMLAFTDKATAFFGVVLGLIILTDALFKIQIAVDSKRFGMSKWWLIALFAAVTCIAGILLVINPGFSAELYMIFAGASLVCEGLLNLFVVIYAVKSEKDRNYDDF